MSHHNDHDLGDVQQAFHAGIKHAGPALNEFVQPALDSADLSSIEDAYLSAINEYGDPLPVVEAISDALDFLAGDCE